MKTKIKNSEKNRKSRDQMPIYRIHSHFIHQFQNRVKIGAMDCCKCHPYLNTWNNQNSGQKCQWNANIIFIIRTYVRSLHTSYILNRSVYSSVMIIISANEMKIKIKCNFNLKMCINVHLTHLTDRIICGFETWFNSQMHRLLEHSQRMYRTTTVHAGHKHKHLHTIFHISIDILCILH